MNYNPTLKLGAYGILNMATAIPLALDGGLR